MKCLDFKKFYLIAYIFSSVRITLLPDVAKDHEEVNTDEVEILISLWNYVRPNCQNPSGARTGTIKLWAEFIDT